MVEELVGEGVEVSNATLNCNLNSRGIYQGIGDLGIDTGIVLSSGNINNIFGATTLGQPDTYIGITGDADLNTIIDGTTYDACVLEFDFVPSDDSIFFNYVFASSEYQAYSCSNLNDVFGYFISGPGIVGQRNMAVIPGTTIPIPVNSTTGVGDWVNSDPDCTDMGP